MELRLTATAGLLALCLATSATGEMYRWTDAEGREHFTMDLHRVPPEHRARVKHEVEMEKLRISPRSEPVINEVKTPDNASVKRALRPGRRYGPAAPAAAATPACQGWQRKQADQLRRNLERWESQIELNEQRERRLVRTDHRLHAANRVAEAEIQRDRAAQALEDFEDDLRRRGVPPGCYR